MHFQRQDIAIKTTLYISRVAHMYSGKGCHLDATQHGEKTPPCHHNIPLKKEKHALNKKCPEEAAVIICAVSKIYTYTYIDKPPRCRN